MSQPFEPDKAEWSDIPGWVTEARDLVRRRWILFSVITCLHILVSVLTRDMGYLTLTLGVVITQCFLVVLIEAAKASDDSTRLPIKACLDQLQRLALNFVVLAIVCTLMALAALMVGSLLAPKVPAVDYSESSVYLAIQWLTPGVARFFFIYAVVTIWGMWFLYPLLTFTELSLREAAVLAKVADRRSDYVFLVISFVPLFVFVLLLLITEIALVAGTLFLPFYAALQYVSFRHIFMRRKSNSPAKVLSAVQRSASA